MSGKKYQGIATKITTTFQCEAAFTLIEVLVVLSTIAVLMGILAPPLRLTREYARQVVCASNMRQAGIALHSYTAINDGWLAGPSTSGAELTRTNTVSDYTRPMSPVQNTDWVSPTMGEALSLPGDTAERMIDILNNKFRCPSHKFKYTYEYSNGNETYGGVDIDTIKYSSYSASLGFHVYHNHNDSDGWEGTKVWDYDVRLMLSIPAGYVPKLNKIGNPAQKVYLMEGSRYISAVARGVYQLSFNSFPRQIQGGNFMLYGPATPLPGDPFSAMLSCEEKQKYAYRHRNKMNVIFFDGHIEDMDVKASTDVRFWLPSGTKIVTARRTNDRNACDGQVIK